VILGFGAFKQVELDEARDLVEMAVTRQPDVLESGFGPLGDAEPVHGDKHRVISGVCWRRAAYGTQIRQGCPTCARTECGRSKGAGFLCSIRSRRAATTIPGAERIETSVGRFLDAVLIFLVPPLLPGENMFQIFLAPAFIIGNALVAVFLAVAFIIRLTVLSVFVPPPLVIGATLLPVLFVPAFFGSAISLPLLGC
jgi:hypothetical protein